MKNEIAIIGMGAILPDALDLSEYWSNILAAKNSIKGISDIYWDINDFYDPNPAARDRSYSYKAGQVSPVEFDSIGFGIAPKVMESISVEQLYALVVAKQALLDADMIGKNAKAFNREKAGVIMAASVGKSAFALSRRQDIPHIKKILKNSGIPDEIVTRVVERLLDAEIEWTENSEPGFLANVVAGRIANRFDLNGTNCAVDAACASSMAALKVAINELLCGDCDVVLAGGVNLDLTSTAFISFCKTPAISKTDSIRPFDADADGMILGDGVAMVVLKRLEDAERDGDRIYSVIKSIGSSGDGRAKSIFAPTKEGQLKALSRAYDKTDINPDAITLIEAHGTGTHVGDGCELSALTEFFEEYGVKQNTVAIGSIKSQIGHSRLTAGMSSLIKTALALYHRTLPPTINVVKDRPDLLASPFFTLDKPQPWIVDEKHPVRRAGVSSFGFGGTNFHVVMEEYKGNANWRRTHRVPTGVCLDACSRNELIVLCENLIKQIIEEPIIYDELLDSQKDVKAIAEDRPRVGFVAKSPDEAIDKLHIVVDILKKDNLSNEINLEKEGIYFRENGVMSHAKVVTLFSGQGAQYTGMFDEIVRDYPEMSNLLSLVGMELESEELHPIADILYGGNSKITNEDAEKALKDTKYTQPALAAVCGGLYEVLSNRGYSEDFIIGHSFGELTGLWATSAIDSKTFAKLAVLRGKLMSEGAVDTGMVSVAADAKSCKKWVDKYRDLYIANENSSTQTVISGNMVQIKELAAKLKDLQISHTVLNVSQAFHSPYMQEASHQFSAALNSVKFTTLKKNLYSGATGKLYGQKSNAAKKTFSGQIESPVRFAKCIEDAYENGARIFVEIGPGKTLTNLTSRILDGKQYYALSIDSFARQKNAHIKLEEVLVYLKVLGMGLCNDIYRKTASELYKTDKPKSSYLITPMGYMTSDKRQIVEKAITTVDAPYGVHEVVTNTLQENSAQIITNGFNLEEYTLEDFYNQEGELLVSKGTLETALGLQTLSTKALEEFLTSQGNQMEVFKELFKEASDNASTNNVLRFVEIFQNNSLRAFEAYMGKQQNISGDADLSLQNNIMIEEPQPRLSYSNASMLHELKEVSPQTTTKPVQVNIEPKEVKAAVVDNTPVPSNAPLASDFDPVQIMIKVISEKSGYPEELIDADMNIESDLGIDSIKRIEIFAEVNNQIPGELNQDDIEAISMLHTIQEIGEYLKKK